MGEQEFVKRCKEELVRLVNQKKVSPMIKDIKESDLYVVWLTKVLQNNKALLSTNIDGDGLYFEVTFNGDKQEFYFDVYKKQENICIKA